MDDYFKDIERIFANAERKSVNANEEEALTREQELSDAYKKGREAGKKAGKRTGFTQGLRAGIIRGVLVAFLAMAIFSAGMKGIDALSRNYETPSYTAGYMAVSSNTHRTQDNQGYWYDYNGISRAFDPETMDFDQYVYGIYNHIGWNMSSCLECMDKVMDYLEDRGFTDSNSFLDYCDSKGLCELEDGVLKVDTSAYKKAIREYITNVKEMEELQGKVDSFKTEVSEPGHGSK